MTNEVITDFSNGVLTFQIQPGQRDEFVRLGRDLMDSVERDWAGG